MKYSILNTDTGDVQEMCFVDTLQFTNWFKIAPDNFKSLGKVDAYLPTRHVRMQNKEEFAGWRS